MTGTAQALPPDFVNMMLLAGTYAALAVSALLALKGLLEETPRVRGTQAALGAVLMLTASIGHECGQGLSVIGSYGGSLIVLAFLMLTMSLAITWRLRTPLVPVLILPLALLFLAAGHRWHETVPVTAGIFLVKIHALVTLLGYTLLFLAAVTALLYLLQDRRLRRRLPLRMSLPSLDVLTHLTLIFNVSAWLLLIVAIGSGALKAAERGTGWSRAMPWVFYGMTGTWLVLTLVLIASSLRWLSGVRAAQASLLVALLALASLLGGAH